MTLKSNLTKLFLMAPLICIMLIREGFSVSDSAVDQVFDRPLKPSCLEKARQGIRLDRGNREHCHNVTGGNWTEGIISHLNL